VRPMPPRPDKTILFTRATVRMLLLFCRKKKVRSSEIGTMPRSLRSEVKSTSRRTDASANDMDEIDDAAR
jgi:hypothetical protein